MTQTGHPLWFATCVSSRRKQRNLTITGLREAGGPTKPVVLMAERGELNNPRPSTLQKFDTGLSWKPGSAANVYWESAQPIVLGRAPYKAGAGNVAVGLDPLTKLLAAQRDMHREVAGLEDRTSGVADLRVALKKLDVAVSAIAGSFVTETLERNHGQHHKAIDSAIAALLEPPVDYEDPEREEKLYRRWLYGSPIEIDQTTAQRFARRLRDSRRR